MARSKKTQTAQVKVARVDDDVFANAYGECWQATVGDWTSEKRSSEARAIADAEAHLASIGAQAADDTEPVEDAAAGDDEPEA